jgi:hypothetical protein
VSVDAFYRGELAGAALLVFEAGADFQQRSSISAHSALRAASCESACSCMFLRR